MKQQLDSKLFQELQSVIEKERKIKLFGFQKLFQELQSVIEKEKNKISWDSEAIAISRTSVYYRKREKNKIIRNSSSVFHRIKLVGIQKVLRSLTLSIKRLTECLTAFPSPRGLPVNASKKYNAKQNIINADQNKSRIISTNTIFLIIISFLYLQ